MTNAQSILLSIKPKYAKMIYDNSKQVELRKVMPKYEIKNIYFYETKPIQKITGYATPHTLYNDYPNRIYELFKNEIEIIGISKKEFDEYYKYSKLAIAIHLKKVKKFENPLTLSEVGIKAPPISYKYLSLFEETIIYQSVLKL